MTLTTNSLIEASSPQGRRRFHWQQCQEALAYLSARDAEIDTYKSRKKLHACLSAVRGAYTYCQLFEPGSELETVIRSFNRRIRRRIDDWEAFLRQRKANRGPLPAKRPRSRKRTPGKPRKKNPWDNPEYRARRRKAFADPLYRELLSKQAKARWQDPAYRQRLSDAVSTPEQRDRRSKASKARWQDPAYRQRLSDAVSTPEQRDRRSKASKARWQDPESRGRLSDAVNTPEQRERRSTALKAKWQDPEYRQRQSESRKARWENPNSRQRHSQAIRAKWQDPGYRQRQSEINKLRWKNPDFRGRRSNALKAYWARQKALSASADKNPGQITTGAS